MRICPPLKKRGADYGEEQKKHCTRLIERKELDREGSKFNRIMIKIVAVHAWCSACWFIHALPLYLCGIAMCGRFFKMLYDTTWCYLIAINTEHRLEMSWRIYTKEKEMHECTKHLENFGTKCHFLFDLCHLFPRSVFLPDNAGALSCSQESYHDGIKHVEYTVNMKLRGHSVVSKDISYHFDILPRHYGTDGLADDPRRKEDDLRRRRRKTCFL